MFRSESNIFENSCVNRFQTELIAVGKTESHFRAAPSSVICICETKFDEVVCLQSSTEFSGSVPVNTMSVFFDVIDDPPKKYEHDVIWSDSGELGTCLNFVN